MDQMTARSTAVSLILTSVFTSQQKFTADGVFVQSFGGIKSSDNGGFYYPQGIAVFEKNADAPTFIFTPSGTDTPGPAETQNFTASGAYTPLPADTFTSMPTATPTDSRAYTPADTFTSTATCTFTSTLTDTETFTSTPSLKPEFTGTFTQTQTFTRVPAGTSTYTAVPAAPAITETAAATVIPANTPALNAAAKTATPVSSAVDRCRHRFTAGLDMKCSHEAKVIYIDDIRGGRVLRYNDNEKRSKPEDKDGIVDVDERRLAGFFDPAHNCIKLTCVKCGVEYRLMAMTKQAYDGPGTVKGNGGKQFEDLNYESTYNYPNPCRDFTEIRFTLSAPARARIYISDQAGGFVREIDVPAAATSPGVNRVIWDPRNSAGARAANGVYVMKVASGQKLATKKAAVIK